MAEQIEKRMQRYQKELKIYRSYADQMWKIAFGDYSKSTKTKLLQEALQGQKDELRGVMLR